MQDWLRDTSSWIANLDPKLLNGLAAILRGIAAILWPIFAIALITLFRKELSGLLARIRKGKAFGAEFETVELNENVAKLDRTSKELTSILPGPTTLVEPPANVDNKSRGQITEIPSALDWNFGDALPVLDLDEIRRTAESSPSLAAIKLAAGIERQVRVLMAVKGVWAEYRPSVLQNLESLTRRGYVPPELTAATRAFWRLRNRLVHGLTLDDDILKETVESGALIYTTLLAIPYELYIVDTPEITLFQDKNCSIEVAGSRGLKLKAILNDRLSYHVYPTNRLGYYKRGMKVSWEWNSEVTLGEAWYRDTHSDAIKMAFSSSANFVGRDLREIV